MATPAQCSLGLPSAVIGPDGHTVKQAPANGMPSLLIATLDRMDARYEIALTKARPWRALARSGDIYRASSPPDERSTNQFAF
jgi:hypothetical protein